MPDGVFGEGRLVRWTLIALAVGFLVLFLVLPLLAVFSEALRRGIGSLLRQLRRSRHPGGDPPDAPGGGHRGAAQPRVRPVGRLGDRQVRVSAARAC